MRGLGSYWAAVKVVLVMGAISGTRRVGAKGPGADVAGLGPGAGGGGWMGISTRPTQAWFCREGCRKERGRPQSGIRWWAGVSSCHHRRALGSRACLLQRGWRPLSLPSLHRCSRDHVPRGAPGRVQREQCVLGTRAQWPLVGLPHAGRRGGAAAGIGRCPRRRLAGGAQRLAGGWRAQRPRPARRPTACARAARGRRRLAPSAPGHGEPGGHRHHRHHRLSMAALVGRLGDARGAARPRRRLGLLAGPRRRAPTAGRELYWLLGPRGRRQPPVAPGAAASRRDPRPSGAFCSLARGAGPKPRLPQRARVRALALPARRRLPRPLRRLRLRLWPGLGGPALRGPCRPLSISALRPGPLSCTP